MSRPKASKATEADRRAMQFGPSAGKLNDEEFGVALGVQGLLTCWNVNWLMHRLRCPLTVESVDGPVEVPPASREFMAFMRELEKISRGGEPERLKLMLETMQQKGKGQAHDAKGVLLMSLFDSHDPNDGSPIPCTLTHIMRVANEQIPGTSKDLADLSATMKAMGMRATPDRSKSGKHPVDQAAKDLKGKALFSAAIRARQPELFKPVRRSRKTE